MMENAQITGSDDNVLLGSTEAAHQTTVPLTMKQKTFLKGYLLSYRQLLHGYGVVWEVLVFQLDLAWSLLMQLSSMLVS